MWSIVSVFCVHTEQKFTINKQNRKLATVHAPKSPKTALGFLCGVFVSPLFFFLFTGIASSRTNTQRILAL